MAVKCIDISAWQGKVSEADFRKIRKQGINYIILRTGYTSQSSFTLGIDSVFIHNIKQAYAAGMKIGTYHYSQAITTAEAKKEAEFTLKIIKNFKSYITLPVFFDWEFGKRLNSSVAKKKGKKYCTDICEAYCDKILASGFKAGVYANTSTMNGYLYPATLEKKYKIWIAEYSKSLSYKRTKYMWQYSSSAKITGLDGNIDINKLYITSSKKKKEEKTPYKGKYPSLPKRGYLCQGDKGNSVRYLQKFLNWYNGNKKLKEDGDFGPATKAAVKAFQKAVKITVDGEVGKNTLKRIKAL